MISKPFSMRKLKGHNKKDNFCVTLLLLISPHEMLKSCSVVNVQTHTHNEDLASWIGCCSIFTCPFLSCF